MPVNVARYRHRDATGWAVVDDRALLPIPGDYASTADFICEAADSVIAGEAQLAEAIPLEDVEIDCPVTSNQQFVCQAINYHSHMAESGIDPTSSPFNIFFRKASSCLLPAHGTIKVPNHVEFCDYEIEIGLVLRRSVTEAVTISDGDLADHVAGLVVVNDVSARDVQIPEGQFYKGKSYRTFGPVGPWLTLVDAADLARFDQLRLRLAVNDDVRQDGLADEMIHTPARSLTELSEIQDWGAGDLLATGTPGGCALQAPAGPIVAAAQLASPKRRQQLIRRSAARNARRLQPGDTITASIRTDDGVIDLGEQRTLVVGGPRSVGR